MHFKYYHRTYENLHGFQDFQKITQMWFWLSGGSPPISACVRRITKAGLTQAEIMKCSFHISDFTGPGLYNVGSVETWRTKGIMTIQQKYSNKIR